MPEPQSTFVDWPLMKAAIWRDTPNDPVRMERRMAEFLVHDRVPFDLLLGVAVQSEDRKTKVERMFGRDTLGLTVTVRSNWYYP